MRVEDLVRLFPFPRGKRLLPTILFPFPLGKGLGVRFLWIICDAHVVAAIIVSSLMLIASTTPALAQNMTATPTPMVMPVIPQIQLQTVPAYGPAPLTVGFFVSSLNPDAPPITSYIWNFGDGQVSMLPPTALFHTYTNPGSYIVNVTVTDSGGHQASSFAAVIVAQPTSP